MWGEDYCGETRTIDTHILTLRQKLGPYGDIIKTVLNVGYRLEVQDALSSGFGESVRYSSTRLEKTSYLARRLSDGSVLRLSVSRATIGLLVLGLLQPILFILAAMLILSALLARRLARRIVKPLNRLDLDHPLADDSA